jgi:hypothetical protein
LKGRRYLPFQEWVNSWESRSDSPSWWVVGEALFADAVVGGLAVLEAFAAGDVGEREEEVVDVVVVRGVGGAGFADEVGDSARSSGRRLESSGSSETTSM